MLGNTLFTGWWQVEESWSVFLHPKSASRSTAADKAANLYCEYLTDKKTTPLSLIVLVPRHCWGLAQWNNWPLSGGGTVERVWLWLPGTRGFRNQTRFQFRPFKGYLPFALIFSYLSEARSEWIDESWSIKALRYLFLDGGIILNLPTFKETFYHWYENWTEKKEVDPNDGFYGLWDLYKYFDRWKLV